MRPNPILVLTFLGFSCTSSTQPTAPNPAPAAVEASAEGAAPEAARSDDGGMSVGDLAPEFALRDQANVLRTVSEHRGRPIVLYFYPKDATPGCTTEACAFRDAWTRLQETGAVVYGVSTDDVASHAAFAADHALPFSLLADTEGEACRAYGVRMRLGMASRVTFLIGRDGRVAQVFEDVDPGVHAAEVIAAIAALPATGPDRAALAAAIAAADRSEADLALDAGRHPEPLLAFFGVGVGMRVAEMFAGGGYTAELLARVVGPSGQVFAQNNAFVLERFAAEPWAARLQSPVMTAVVRVDRELDTPLPEAATQLDFVLFNLAYHDTVWMGTDRAAMNRAIFQALRPGGVYGVVDHSAAPGRGLEDVQTLHRIERSVVIAEITGAGFELVEEARFLENPDDTRDWNASPSQAAERRGTSDRFVLKFRRPL